MVCGNFILPEPASYVFFYAFSNLRNLLYIIKMFVVHTCLLLVFCGDYILPEIRMNFFLLHLIVYNSPITKKRRRQCVCGVLAGEEGFEPSAYGFGDRRSTN